MNTVKNNTKKQSLEKSTLALIFFVVFVLAFISLGGAQSFRSGDPAIVASSITAQSDIDPVTEDFVHTYTPYLTYFVSSVF